MPGTVAVFLPLFAQFVPQVLLLLHHLPVCAAFFPLFLFKYPLGLFFNLHLHVLLVGPFVGAIGLLRLLLSRLEHFHDFGQEFSLGFRFELGKRDLLGSVGFDHYSLRC